LRPMVASYCAGLTSLEAESVSRYQQSFNLLSDEDQYTLLRFVEAGAVLTTWDVAPPFFFSLLVNTTVEGFYSDPEQGGNRNAVSWTMTSFEEALERGNG
jgi:gluconate 2-dehydrogenase gamma chain